MPQHTPCTLAIQNMDMAIEMAEKGDFEKALDLLHEANENVAEIRSAQARKDFRSQLLFNVMSIFSMSIKKGKDHEETEENGATCVGHA